MTDKPLPQQTKSAHVDCDHTGTLPMNCKHKHLRVTCAAHLTLTFNPIKNSLDAGGNDHRRETLSEKHAKQKNNIYTVSECIALFRGVALLH